MSDLPWYEEEFDISCQPKSLSELALMIDNASKYLWFLMDCEKTLMKNWRKSWVEVYAVGPFINRNIPTSEVISVAIVVVARMGTYYGHIKKIAGYLADIVADSCILPVIDVYIEKDGCTRGDAKWEEMKERSIRWCKP